MRIFEYKNMIANFVPLDEQYEQNKPGLMEMLNKQGKEGWEIVEIKQKDEDVQSFELLFKRQKWSPVRFY